MTGTGVATNIPDTTPSKVDQSGSHSELGGSFSSISYTQPTQLAENTTSGSAVAPQNPFEQVSLNASLTDQSMASSDPIQLSPTRVGHKGISPTGSPVHVSQPTPASEFRRAPQVPMIGSENESSLRSSIIEDDEHTEPSSAANTSSSNPIEGPRRRSDQPEGERTTGSLARFFESTWRRTNHSRDSEDDDDLVDGVLIAGYLQKLGRNGKWQTRWFETDGEGLSYYKSSKRTELLATLDLGKVGKIEIDEEDTKGCGFFIQVLGRLYNLRARSRASCKDWVITLNRVKEARLHQGNVKLVAPKVVDLLDSQAPDAVAPRVVVVANRYRSHAIDNENSEWQNMVTNSSTNTDSKPAKSFDSQQRIAHLATAAMVGWRKRKSSVSRLAGKFSKWARSIRKLSCANVDGVEMDTNNRSPYHRNDTVGEEDGADTPVASVASKGKIGNNKDSLSLWIGKEAQLTSSNAQKPGTSAPSVMPLAVNDETRPITTGTEDDMRVIS